MKFILNILLFLFYLSCSTTKKLSTTDNIVFKKKDIGYNAEYKIASPNLEDKNKTYLQMIGGHGHGFQIVYSDSETIYYTNDYGSATPNYQNYQTVGWSGFAFKSVKDTTLSGQQVNGLYWKEIKNGRDNIGYLNVSKKDIDLFDKALLTFKKR